MRPTACAVALILCLAGCSDSGDPPPTPASTQTPATAGAPPPISVAAGASTTLPAAAAEPAAAPIPICASFPSGSGVQFNTGPIRDYGAERPDVWGGLGFANDGERLTAVVVVTEEAADHARNLGIYVPPGVALEVRIGEHTQQRLLLAVAAIDAALGGTPGYLGSRVNVVENRAMVEVVADDAALREAIATTGLAALVCLAPHTGAVTAWGTQAQAGDGWRVVGESLGTPIAFVSAAVGAAGYRAMWRRHFAGEPPPVDHDTEVVLLFGATVSGCPQILFDGVDVRGDAVLPVFAPVGPVGPCRLVARPHGYAVAVDRAALPDRFEIRLSDDPPRPEADDRLFVDLTDPDGDRARWGTALVGMEIVPPVTGAPASLDLRFFDGSGTLVYAGTDAVEVDETGAPVRARRRPPAELVAGPARLDVAVCADPGCADRIGTCTWEGTAEAFTELELRIEVLHTGDGDGPACRIALTP